MAFASVLQCLPCSEHPPTCCPIRVNWSIPCRSAQINPKKSANPASQTHNSWCPCGRRAAGAAAVGSWGGRHTAQGHSKDAARGAALALPWRQHSLPARRMLCRQSQPGMLLQRARTLLHISAATNPAAQLLCGPEHPCCHAPAVLLRVCEATWGAACLTAAGIPSCCPPAACQAGPTCPAAPACPAAAQGTPEQQPRLLPPSSAAAA